MAHFNPVDLAHALGIPEDRPPTLRVSLGKLFEASNNKAVTQSKSSFSSSTLTTEPLEVFSLAPLVKVVMSASPPGGCCQDGALHYTRVKASSDLTFAVYGQYEMYSPYGKLNSVEEAAKTTITHANFILELENWHHPLGNVPTPANICNGFLVDSANMVLAEDKSLSQAQLQDVGQYGLVW